MSVKVSEIVLGMRVFAKRPSVKRIFRVRCSIRLHLGVNVKRLQGYIYHICLEAYYRVFAVRIERERVFIVRCLCKEYLIDSSRSISV